MLPPPQPLPDEIVVEVLLRIPPENPAGLVRAGLVCRRWCRLVSDPGFRRRFREFHGRPPLLGMFCNNYNDFRSDLDKLDMARFVPTTAFPRTNFPGLNVLDARHGRVLYNKGSALVVWDPITDEVRELPHPLQPGCFTAVVLCSAAAGACNHLDCHNGPFLVVCVSFNVDRCTVVYTYSSIAAAWTETVSDYPHYLVSSWMGSALVGNTLYFGNLGRTTVLEYDLDMRRASLLRLPSLPRRILRESRLTTMDDGGLGLINKDDSRLYMWSRKDTHEVDAKWERRVVIELKTMFPVDVDVTKLGVIGFGVGIIFMRTGDEVYTIDLKTYEVKKVYKGAAHQIVPYMSFYTPVLRVATTGKGPSAGASTAEQT